MITVSNVSLQFGGDTLFKNVDLQFNAGNCYGVIGANGAGKSTFLKILCGQLKPTTGEVNIPKNLRMSVLKQDHFAYDEYTVLDTIIMGNQRLYDMLNNNPMVRLFRGDVNNDPRTVAKNDNFVAINSAVNVDLTGQICAESIGSRQYSGSGGQFDMTYGALHSRGGRSIIALPSTQKDGTVSTISAQLTPGSAVTTSRCSIDYVVTEFGIAPLAGRNFRQRVDNLISIAHPDFRAQLRKDAERLMLW